MYVLDVDVFCQVRDLLGVKLMPKDKEKYREGGRKEKEILSNQK